MKVYGDIDFGNSGGELQNVTIEVVEVLPTEEPIVEEDNEVVGS